MFSRRRAQSNPPQRAPNSAAATAAAQAFLANRASNANLSSAAAAAALRTHTTPPIPVSEVQTKRMIQRQSSTSSHGSAPNGSVRRSPGLQRQNSSGSMTERTFREPSPNGRPVSRPIHDDPPPLPALPKVYSQPPPLPTRSDRRPASVEPPERLGSPPIKIVGGRGVSLDRGPGVMVGRLKNQKANNKNVSLGSVTEFQRPGSVNFSRPMSPQNSPPASPQNDGRQSLPTSDSQNSTLGTKVLTTDEINNIEFSVQESANKPVKKKPRRVVSTMTEGSHLASSGQTAKPMGASVQIPSRQGIVSNVSTSPSLASDPQGRLANNSSPTLPKTKKRRPKGTSESSQSQSTMQSYGSDSDTVSERSVSSDRPRHYNTRAAGLLTKQPSIVREDREAEEQEEKSNIITKTKNETAPNGGISITIPGKESVDTEKPRVQNGSVHPTSPKAAVSTEKQIPLQPSMTQSRERSSLSPSRATHFSIQPIYETPDGTRHQPPGRSVSPAKSALKHSPSSRGNSPAGMPGGWNRPGHAPSEASDTTSIVSEDGFKSASRKKKNVRVSFDDDPTVVGRAATPPASADSPVIFSPQSKDNAKKGWFGLGKDKKASQYSDDNDGVMKPVPTLPSFGSVRGYKETRDSAVASQYSSAENDKSISDSSKLEVSSTSSDHAVGGILSQDFATKTSATPAVRSLNDPLPPEVTSVEGTGYISDSEESLVSDNGEMTGPSISSKTEELSKVSDAPPGSPRREIDMVPMISIQPATPGIDDSTQRTAEWLGEMPGMFPPSTEYLNNRSAIDQESSPTDLTPSNAGIAEPEPEAAAAYHNPASPVMGEVSQSLQHQIAVQQDDESDDTGESIYSDAAEDMSDLEGDGFGSINAIVESPASVPPAAISPLLLALGQGNVNTNQPKDEEPEPELEDGWDKTQAYWSGLSQSRKTELETEATSGPLITTKEVVTNPTAFSSSKIVKDATVQPAPKPKKKKAKAKTAERIQEKKSTAINTQVQHPLNKPAEAVPMMRKSMRGQPVEAPKEATQLRSSMRNSLPAQSSMRTTVLPTGSPEPKGTLQKKIRPVSAVPMVDYNNDKTRQSRQGLNGVASQSLTPVATKPFKKSAAKARVLGRSGSNGSDSSSSFKKARPVAANGGRYTMKRSMRSASVDERPRTSTGGRAFSVRSVSPAESTSRRPFSSAGPSMRTSLRADGGEPKSSKSSFGFGRGLKSPAAPQKSSSSRFSSRFGDSSDEDEPPQRYASRFRDSSDEDEPSELPKGLTPVRGIPKRIDEGDSTDLEDSSEETPGSPKKGAKKSMKGAKHEGAALASGSLRQNGPSPESSKPIERANGVHVRNGVETEKKKRSFFGSLGRKKDDSKVKKADVESAARRDTPLERTKMERTNTEPLSPTPQSPKSPKLQRRNTPQRFASDSWPLPPSPVVTDIENRPNTSNGVPASSRPGLGSRKSTVDSTGAVLSGRTGKKKRFPMLRKAFGLQD